MFLVPDSVPLVDVSDVLPLQMFIRLCCEDFLEIPFALAVNDVIARAIHVY